MADGAPNGYSIISFDGTDYKLDFHAAGRSPDYQIELDAPELVSTSQLAETIVSANFFNGSEHSVVEMRVDDGAWRPMEHARTFDPKYQRHFDREAAVLETKKEAWRGMAKPKPSTHLWQGALPGDLRTGTHKIEVRATDDWDRTFTEARVLRVTEPPTGS